MDQVQWVVDKAYHYIELGKEKYDGLSSVGKTTLWGYVALHVLGFLTVLIITPARLFESKLECMR